MKKIVFLALAFVTLQVTAQDGPREFHRGDRERMHNMANLTPEEMATLQTKKMTLDLDLTKAQQEKIQKINLERAKERKTRMAAMKEKKESGAFEKPSKEERVKMMNDRLDRQIAMKKQMKEILSEEQYNKWSEHRAKMGKRMHHKRDKHSK